MQTRVLSKHICREVYFMIFSKNLHWLFFFFFENEMQLKPHPFIEEQSLIQTFPSSGLGLDDTHKATPEMCVQK